MRNSPSTPRRIRSAHESKSATVRAAAAAPSRRQQTRWQRDQHQQRLLFIAVGVLVLLVVAIFAGGLVFENVVQGNAAVAQVGPDSITASQLLEEVRPEAAALDNQAKQFGGGQQIADYVTSQKRSLPNSVLNNVVDDRIIRQEAARRGISVSPADVDNKERQTVADFQAASNPAPTPAPEASPTDQTFATPEASGAALTLATPQPTTLPTPAAAVTPTTPTPVPTLDESAYGPALQQLLQQDGFTEADFRKQLERSLLRTDLQSAVGAEKAASTQPEVHARQIQAASPDVANDLLSQLQNGADFAQLAQQNSTDAVSKDNGGDVGWFARGTHVQAFDDATFALQAGQLSDVIRDANGYHVIQVLEVDPNHPVPADQVASLQQKAFSDWLTAQHSSSSVTISLNQSETNWILAHIGVRP
jgi:parvulin-like peptidyl-prolyl isomerase